MLDYLARELDPRQDAKLWKETLDRNIFHDPRVLNLFTQRVYTAVKPQVRGQTYGAIFGGIAGILTGEDITKSLVAGMVTGYAIDITQYYSRAIYFFGKRLLKDMNS